MFTLFMNLFMLTKKGIFDPKKSRGIFDQKMSRGIASKGIFDPKKKQAKELLCIPFHFVTCAP